MKNKKPRILTKFKKENIITTGNNPPPKIIKEGSNKTKSVKKKDKPKEFI